MQFLMHPLAVYVFMVAGFAGLLLLHFAALARIEAVRRRLAEEKGISRMEFERLRAQLLEEAAAREESGGTVASTSAAPLNLSKRSQALRMSRRGDPAERIAASLGIPRREVDLLLKVQRTMAGAV